jgi:DNA-binding XRE family transcriptional regulator
MQRRKRARLEAAGWRIGSVADFLGLAPAEAAYVEMKIALARRLRARRRQRGLSQAALAHVLGSSQSRVAKMERADPTVSADLLIRALLALGSTRRDLALAIGRRTPAPTSTVFRRPAPSARSGATRGRRS